MNDFVVNPHPVHEHSTDVILLRKVRRVINLFRALEGRIPSSYIDAFLLVAITPSLGPTEYAKGLNTSQPIASRILLELGKHAREREQQLDLVDRQPDPQSLVRQTYTLTGRGRMLVREILAVMKED